MRCSIAESESSLTERSVHETEPITICQCVDYWASDCQSVLLTPSYLGVNESIVACPGRETASPQGVMLTETKFLLKRSASERRRMYLSSMSHSTSVIRMYSSLTTCFFNVGSL